MFTDLISTVAPVVEQCHQCLLWMIPVLDKLPRQRRFTLGERIEVALLDVLSLVTQASYQKNKDTTLTHAQQRLTVVIHLWRLCFELKVIDKRRYLYASEQLVAIGRQLGGWQRHTQRAK